MHSPSELMLSILKSLYVLFRTIGSDAVLDSLGLRNLMFCGQKGSAHAHFLRPSQQCAWAIHISFEYFSFPPRFRWTATDAEVYLLYVKRMRSVWMQEGWKLDLNWLEQQGLIVPPALKQYCI